MRVLFSCVPQTGHINPLVPLARAFQSLGDEVVLASGPDAEPVADAMGLAFRQAGPSFGEWYQALQARTRGVPGDGLAPERIEHYFLPRLFGEVGAALMLDPLLEVARQFGPGLLVFEPFVFAAPLVADVLGIRAVQHSIGPMLDAGVVQLVSDVMSPIWRQFDRNVPALAGLYPDPTLAICPPSLDPAGAGLPNALFLRPVGMPLDPAPSVPVDLPRPGAPVIYVTLGTFSNTNTALFRLILDALADHPVNVVVTVGNDQDPQGLEPWPANARVERFVPQDRLLPHCAAVVHHGGAGTTFGVLAHGLPAVALPQSADNFTISARLAAAGVARVLMPDDVTADEVGRAVREVLDVASYRSAAENLAREIGAMSPPEEVARALRDLVGGDRRVPPLSGSGAAP